MTLDSNVSAQGFIFPSCEAFLYFFFLSLPFSLLVLLFVFCPIPPIPRTCLPSFFLPLLLLLPSSRIASLLHIQLPLCSHPHPSLLLSSRLFPAPRYRQSLLSSWNTLLVLSRKQPRKTTTVIAAVRMLRKAVIQSGLALRWTELSLVYNAIACLLQL